MSKKPKIEIIGKPFTKGTNIHLRFNYPDGQHFEANFSLGTMPQSKEEFEEILKDLYEQNRPKPKPKFKIPVKVDWEE